MDECDNIFVYPAMGEDGLSSGATFVFYFKNNPNAPKEDCQISDIYKVDSFSDEEIKRALNDNNISFERLDDVEIVIARYMAVSKVVVRYNGHLEYVPRD